MENELPFDPMDDECRMEDCLEALSPMLRLVAGLAEGRTFRKKPFTLEYVMQMMGNTSPGAAACAISKGTAEKLIRTLCKKNILIPNPDQRGCYTYVYQDKRNIR